MPSRRRLRRLMQRVLQAAGQPDAEVCLSFSDDSELRALNQRFAHEDHATDVLSFSQVEGNRAMPRSPALLGDIVISVETAEAQARERGQALDAELLHLAVHGFCHLLGYDHATKNEEAVMFAYEAKLRTAAGARGPVRVLPLPEDSQQP
jgi:probable rRNA maturation factor